MYHLINLVFVIFAYLLGSISSAIVVCKIMRLPDPRTGGSGNPGATNVLRLGGKKAAIITLIGDILKGAIPVLLAHLCGITGVWLAWVAFAAFLGHLFPVFFRFQGGKGVATSFGAIVTLSWPVGLASLAVWVLVAGLFRYSSLAAICAAICMPIFAYFLASPAYVPVLALMGIVIIFMHRSNIIRIIQGTEGQIGSNEGAPQMEKGLLKNMAIAFALLTVCAVVAAFFIPVTIGAAAFAGSVWIFIVGSVVVFCISILLLFVLTGVSVLIFALLPVIWSIVAIVLFPFLLPIIFPLLLIFGFIYLVKHKQEKKAS